MTTNRNLTRVHERYQNAESIKSQTSSLQCKASKTYIILCTCSALPWVFTSYCTLQLLYYLVLNSLLILHFTVNIGMFRHLFESFWVIGRRYLSFVELEYLWTFTTLKKKNIEAKTLPQNWPIAFYSFPDISCIMMFVSFKHLVTLYAITPLEHFLRKLNWYLHLGLDFFLGTKYVFVSCFM